MEITHSTPANRAADMAGQNVSSSAAQEKVQKNKGSRRTRRLGMPWIRRYTHYSKDPTILELIKHCGHAAYAWLDFILLHLASLWEAEGEQGLEYSLEYWLEQVCLLGPENLKEFELFLKKAHDLDLLIVERKGDQVRIASPDLVALADEYTRKKRRRQEKQSKRETTRTRLARLEEQVAKLTETVERLANVLQGQSSHQDRDSDLGEASVPEVPSVPTPEEAGQILKEFEDLFGLKTEDWRKAVILLAFPPKEAIGPGYLARMKDLSQAGRALSAWRARRKGRPDVKELERKEEAKVYARMIRDGLSPKIPNELKPLVQKILGNNGGNGHARV